MAGLRTEQIEVRKLLLFEHVIMVTEKLESKFYTHIAQGMKIQNMDFILPKNFPLPTCASCPSRG